MEQDKKSLTKGWCNKFLIVFWGLAFLGLIAAVGKGPLELDIARLTIAGMVVMGIIRGSKPQRCSFTLFTVVEILLLGILLTAGVMSKNGLVLLMGILAGIILLYIIIQARFAGWRIGTP